jgi:hypothetical protein
MSETSRKVLRGGCVGSVLGGALGAILAGGSVAIIFYALGRDDPGPHMFPFLHPSRSEAATMAGFLAAFPGAFVGTVAGAIRGSRNAVSGPSQHVGESMDEELARLREQVKELEAKANNEAIQRNGYEREKP